MKKQTNFKRLMEYAGGYKYLTYTSLLLSAVSALCALVPFYYLWEIIREVLEVMPNFRQAENIVHNGWMAVLFAVLAMLIYTTALMCSHVSAFRVQANLRIGMMKHIVKLPLGAAESFGSGKLRKIVNECSESTETYLAHNLPDRARAVTTPAGILIFLFAFDWRMGLFSLIPALLGFIIISAMTGKRMEESMKKYQESLNDMANEAVEYVRGIPVVKTFGQTIFSFKRFKASIDNYSSFVIEYTKSLRLPMMFLTTAINGIFAFLMAAGGIFQGGGVTREFVLNLIFYIIITPALASAITKIMYQSENKLIVNDALSRIDSVMDCEPLEESSSPQKPWDGSVELRNVTFSYDGQKDAVKNISMKIEDGATVAFIGPSGGGKTTLANIISRFFDPQKGEVLIGDVDVRDMDKKTLMDTVSFVFQNSRLIKASVLDNVRMGRPQAGREEVMQALKDAQCMDIVEKLPRGIDTVIGEKGVYLSGGEQQRIAIARTLLKNSPVVILDEATAFADPDNESKVQKAFAALSREKTVIMIAHRLSTVTDAEKIYVLRNGEIVEEGSAGDLLEKPEGIFNQMWKDYQTSVKWKVSNNAEEVKCNA